MKLLLTDDEGTVLKTWSIAFEYDYDLETGMTVPVVEDKE
jgi:hypothetical protein